MNGCEEESELRTEWVPLCTLHKVYKESKRRRKINKLGNIFIWKGCGRHFEF